MGRIATLAKQMSAAHSGEGQHNAPSGATRSVLLVGSPNVGKSALFNYLTGRYVTVSNYPGTTVEISRGQSRLLGGDYDTLDTPGMYSLMPITDEERVGRTLLMSRSHHAIVHVIDAKSIDRMLGFTLQLIQAQLPVVLVLNMWDEAAAEGVKIDCDRLEQILGVPVVPTVATKGKGVKVLIERIKGLRAAHAGETPAIRAGKMPATHTGETPVLHASETLATRAGKMPATPPATLPSTPPSLQVDYGDLLEKAIADIQSRLSPDGPLSLRARAILLLHGDHDEQQRLQATCPQQVPDIGRIVWEACMALKHTPHYHTAVAIKDKVDQIVGLAVTMPSAQRQTLRDRISDICMNPWTGFPLLVAVLYFGLYQFVGQFGAGTVVGFLEDDIFVGHVAPAVAWATGYIPWQSVRDLFGGDYGIITLGLRYAVAVVLPIVGAFFLVFSILEDSGYLPRLAMLIDRIFKKIGLSGRAVIPMVLGFGCGTMATMVTRTLETKRERLVATFLLALAIPCSAQLGLILGLLSAHPAAMLLWAGIMGGVFLLAGLFASRLIPGERPSFYMELPPLRLPRIGNVLLKTYTRMAWYFKEILPLFILASVVIWLGQLTGAFEWVVSGLVPVMYALGLPAEAATAFLFGFFRRDYGAAGLYDLANDGLLTAKQMAVAAVTLTLFLPCVAQFLIMRKERGWKVTAMVTTFIALFAFAVGWLLNMVLGALNVQL